MEANEDGVFIDILSRLTRAEEEEDMDAAFEELQALNEVRERQFRKHVDKERAEEGIARRVGASALEEAAAEWGMELPEGFGQPKDEPSSG